MGVQKAKPASREREGGFQKIEQLAGRLINCDATTHLDHQARKLATSFRFSEALARAVAALAFATTEAAR